MPDLHIVAARYTPALLGEGAIVSCQWVEGAATHTVALPLLDGHTLHYEDCLDLPMSVLQALADVLADAPEAVCLRKDRRITPIFQRFSLSHGAKGAEAIRGRRHEPEPCLAPHLLACCGRFWPVLQIPFVCPRCGRSSVLKR